MPPPYMSVLIFNVGNGYARSAPPHTVGVGTAPACLSVLVYLNDIHLNGI